MSFARHLGITASASHATTYFLCVCLFSISFLVFLNSAISFVITDRIGQKDNVGDAVGTLGFADELLALVACPLWGVLSDRIGVRAVAVAGYSIVGLALASVTLAKDVYPQLLLVRILFALGGAATATMVTAILPAMALDGAETSSNPRDVTSNGTSAEHRASASSSSNRSVPSSRVPSSDESTDRKTASSRLAGYVGVFTGCGALVALSVFLPLPAHFQSAGQSPAQAIATSFLIVAAVALAVAVACYFGLANLPSESGKSFTRLIKGADESGRNATHRAVKFYPELLIKAISLGFRDVDVALAYIGGVVARASSVAISLFIPLFINAYFISSGRCGSIPGVPQDPSEIKKNCREAYLTAAKLAGVSQMVALLFAPVFGYLSAKYKLSNAPLLLAAAAGLAGNTVFARLQSPDPAYGGGSGVYFLVMLIGIGQIGAIVCSLGLLARGIHSEETPIISSQDDSESSPLISGARSNEPATRAHLKGSIAGVYSLGGGAGILFLTKVGGLLFDKVDTGAPFYIMSAFNAVLLIAGAAVAVINYRRASANQ